MAGGRKGSSHPGEDAESLPPGGFTSRRGEGCRPLFQSPSRRGGPVGLGKISGAHSLSVSPYLSCLPAQSLVLFKVCGSWEFVQFFPGL